jgi:Mycothiol maleylpyruvate isomerase N-terminal domain
MTVDARALFVETARVVEAAIADDAVGRRWDEPSVLEEQLVGGLAGHLARGGVWVVEEYLSADLPDAPRVDSAAQYYAQVIEAADDDTHRLVRERGALIAVAGQREVCDALHARLDALEIRLRDEPDGRMLGVVGGALTMPLDEFVKTRIVEQVVHLDDLARSVDREPWPVPPAALDLVIHIGIDVARIRRGANATIRALYRSRLDPVLPVL